MLTRRLALGLLASIPLAACASSPAPDARQIYLVRHAEKAAGDDPDLTVVGRARADILANELKQAGLTAIYSTDTRRTRQTALPIAKATGLTGRFSKLLVKDSKTMFMLRSGDVPLRTQDGGSSWNELNGATMAQLYKYKATFDGVLSWTGNTLVVHGVDLGAIGRGEYGTAVWKSTDDGETWSDETGDLVTISPGPGVWYDKDFYFVTRGEGVCVKRDFEK